MRKYVLFFLLITINKDYAYAQSQNRLMGKVTDSKSNPIAGATLHLLNTNFTTITDAKGNFFIEDILAGKYILLISAVGYASVNRELIINGSHDLILTLQETIQQLDEVIVSAQKLEEELQNMPISITALSSRKAEEYRLWNSKDLTAIAPNLYAADPGDKRNVTSLRGITTTSYDPAVATYIDGVSQFGLDTYIAQLFDIERIEILRGPQGTLYGRNAMAGVINIITKSPANRTDGYGEISIGNYGQQRYSLGIRTPLIRNKLFFGAAGVLDGLDGFYINGYNNSKYDKQQSITGNYYLKLLPASKWALMLNVKHNNNRNNGPFPLVIGVQEAFNNPYRLNQNAITKIIDNTWNSSLSMNYAGSSFNFNSQTSYQSNYRYYNKPIDADFSPIDGITIINNYGKDWNNVKVISQEFKFTSPAAVSNFKWIGGTYLFYQHNPVKQTTRFGEDAALVGSPDKNYSLINTTKAKSSGFAFYGQATYSINPKLDMSLGLRYDNEYKKQGIFGEYQQDPDPNPIFAYRSDTSATASFQAFSPKLSIVYSLFKGNILFATYSKGYRAGGLTPFSPDPSQPPLYAFKPEHSNNIEAGIKNTLLDNRLLINVTAFYTTVTNAQVPTLILPDAVTITKNTGKFTSKGIELEVDATAGHGFELHYNFGYNNAEYKILKLSQNGSEVNLKGKHQIFTPDITSMLAAQYSYEIGKKQNLKFILRGEWKYLGRQYFDLANTIRQSSYSILNTRLGIAAKNFSIMVWGRNLGNKKYISYAYDFGAIHLGDPKTYGVTFATRM